jgi:D-alanine-D-alanine ligase
MTSAPREMAPTLPGSVEKTVREAATTVAAIARVRGVARVDFLVQGDEVYLNEINTIPGSLAKHLWVDPPIPFADLLATMLEEAERRPTTNWTTAGADGSALRSAGEINAKLG